MVVKEWNAFLHGKLFVPESAWKKSLRKHWIVNTLFGYADDFVRLETIVCLCNAV